VKRRAHPLQHCLEALWPGWLRRLRVAAPLVWLWLVLASCLVPAAGAGVQDEPEIRDPLLEFLIEITRHDSLGIWSNQQLRDYEARSGRTSRLPLTHIRSIERRPASSKESERRRGVRVGRIWRLVLDQDLRLPMPYSILGYHPGNLFISSELVFSEWRLGAPNIHVVAGDTVRVMPSQQMTAYRLDRGWVILDVAALIDRLLGGKLDDSWTVGFATCRIEGRLYGLGLGLSRGMRKFYGEMDFQQDKILTHGGAVANAISCHVRPWMDPPPGSPERAWEFSP
jgi:hypothetical protein